MAYPPREPEYAEERMSIPFSHGALAATTTVQAWKVPAGRKFVVDRILYVNPTGLTGDNTNNFRGELKNGATLMSTLFNTDTNDAPAGASLAANAFLELDSNAEVPSRGAAAGDTLTVVFTLEGTQTLPAGNGLIEGRLQ